MFNLLINRVINSYINNFTKKMQKTIANSEKCRTFAPAELNEGLPLKMI